MFNSDLIAANKNYCEVRDYCHYTGKYLGAAHSTCNFCYKENSFIPVVAYNTPNFDNHSTWETFAQIAQFLSMKRSFLMYYTKL